MLRRGRQLLRMTPRRAPAASSAHALLHAGRSADTPSPSPSSASHDGSLLPTAHRRLPGGHADPDDASPSRRQEGADLHVEAPRSSAPRDFDERPGDPSRTTDHPWRVSWGARRPLDLRHVEGNSSTCAPPRNERRSPAPVDAPAAASREQTSQTAHPGHCCTFTCDQVMLPVLRSQECPGAGGHEPATSTTRVPPRRRHGRLAALRAGLSYRGRPRHARTGLLTIRPVGAHHRPEGMVRIPSGSQSDGGSGVGGSAWERATTALSLADACP